VSGILEGGEEIPEDAEIPEEEEIAEKVIPEVEEIRAGGVASAAETTPAAKTKLALRPANKRLGRGWNTGGGRGRVASGRLRRGRTSLNTKLGATKTELLRSCWRVPLGGPLLGRRSSAWASPLLAAPPPPPSQGRRACLSH